MVLSCVIAVSVRCYFYLTPLCRPHHEPHGGCEICREKPGALTASLKLRPVYTVVLYRSQLKGVSIQRASMRPTVSPLRLSF